MTVVVDIGCADRDSIPSIPYLVERFEPSEVFAFDPFPLLEEKDYEVGDTAVHVRRKAAWTNDGTTRYIENGFSSTVGMGDIEVDCFDFNEWLTGLDTDEEIVVKLDCEGAEYPLLERLIGTAAERRISLLLVEWHDAFYDDERRDAILARLHTAYEEWEL